MPAAQPGVVETARSDRAGYTVVARRYRPRRFDEVVGQDHVVQALGNAIKLNRVTHAYLFSGTRGVGKTSIARIFAKCLNCVQGPTTEPCLECDICEAIAAGQDVDVIEIDGASNNGVEAVRELRQNVSLRPSRSRFKIYYIDEVHMLSQAAFNALLKTLEEPPEHVKFFFATTEAQKIPITVLSRCQRYDFAAISADLIVETLGAICVREGVEAEPDALSVVARRAAGSMRDAQSLLEQVLSYGGEKLTSERVHELLGIASDDRVLELLESIARHDVAGVLRQLEEASNQGIQPTELLGGAIEFLRDVMVLAGLAPGVPMMAASPRQVPRVQALAESWSLDSILASLQILAEARGRLRGSPHARLLVELALVRVARLENLTELGELVARLAAIEARGGGTPMINPGPSTVSNRIAAAGPASVAPSPTRFEPKKKPKRPDDEPRGEPGEPPPTSLLTPRTPDSTDSASSLVQDAAALNLETAIEAWKQLPERLGVMLGSKVTRVRPTAVEAGALVIGLTSSYNWFIEECGSKETRNRIETELTAILHQPVIIRFESLAKGDSAALDASDPQPTPVEAFREDPLVRRVVDLFQAQLAFVEHEKDRETDP